MRERTVWPQNSVLIAAIDSARRTDRPHPVHFFALQRLVQSTRANEVWIAGEIARWQEIDEQRGLVRVPINAARVVLCRAPLTARERRLIIELAVLQPQVAVVLGRVHPVVERPREAVRVVLDVSERLTVGI